VAKDVALMKLIKANPTLADELKFDRIEWVFFANAAGDGFPDPRLLELLKDEGLPFRVYLAG
jgi:hypothetical protein